MSLPRLRLVPSMLALAAVALLVAGCSTTPASPAPTSTGSSHDHGNVQPGDLDAAWLDAGRMIGIVTWGSSTPTCQPFVKDLSDDGQQLIVTLDYPAEASKGCDSDLRPHAVAVGVPDGIDITEDVQISIRGTQDSGTVTLAGLAKAPEGPSDEWASAGWFADDGILLLTRGSSSCPPQLEDVEMTDASATVRFATIERICTMDMAPRVTPIVLPMPADRTVPFVLTLQGDHLDGEVPVIG